MGSTSVTEKQASAAEAADLTELTELSVKVGNLLHETQKERGATAVYMSSAGAKFASELPTQQATTDGPRAELYAFLDERMDQLPIEVQTGLEPALAALAELDDRRASALALTADTRPTIGYFTDMNGKFLDAIASIGSVSSNADLTRATVAYLAFLNAKENAGIERAQLSNVFGEDQFAEGQYATVVGLIANQKSFLPLFEATASPDVLAFFADKQIDPIVAETQRLEDIAVSNGDAGFGVDSAVWFDTITARINLLKTVEDFQADAIISRSGSLQAEAGGALRNALVLIFGAISIAVAISIFMIKTMTGPMNRLSETSERMAQGDIGVDVESVDGNDEISTLQRSMATSLDYLRESRSGRRADRCRRSDSPARTQVRR
jgi:methyl-accepting chemotaxis protein